MPTKKLLKQFTSIIVMALLASYVQANSALRVSCKGDAVNAAIFINGKAYGNCPSAIFLTPGEIHLRVVKTVDAKHERIFEKTLTLFDSVVKQVKVNLSAPQLNPQYLKTEVQEALTNARAGDIAAMIRLSELYKQGLGLEKNTEKSEYWSRQASDKQDENTAKAILERAEAGDINAMSQIERLYLQGKGIKKDATKAKHWQQKREQVIFAKEAQEAQRVLSLAESGDIDAMLKMADFYTSGTGVESNSNKAKEWQEKAELSKNIKYQEKINHQRKKELQEELEDYKSAKTYLSGFITAGKMVGMDAKAGDTDTASSIITFSPTVLVVTVVGLASDLVSAPFHATKHIQLQNELNARAAVWNNPKSMIAKAHSQKTKVQ